MEKRAVSFAVGVGGWDHAAFDACLYPKANGDSLERLSFYSRFFDTVEVRATFWDDTLAEQDARQWIDAVAGNKRFTFNLKLHSLFTHKKQLKPQLTRNVRAMLQELSHAGRLGSLVAQFAYSFTNTSANRFHLVKLGEVFRGFPLHVEFRHESWNHPTLLNFLAENLLAPVNADLPRVRQLMPFITGVVGDHAYLRLHGRNEKGWLLNGMETRYDYLYNSKELRELGRRLDALSQKCSYITVICNNTTHGKAVANAFQILSLLRDGRHVLVSQATLNAFPHLQDIASVVESSPLLHQDGYKKVV